MPDYLAPVSSALGARYRYYTVNIVTNTVIGEIPFEDVSYERSIKSPGSFDGKITISEQTVNLDLYNSTMPGKTALYVVRDNEAVWGGIIWGRTYDLKGRSLAISASEFTSYLSHRIVWKTYSHNCTAQLTKLTATSYVQVDIQDKVLKSALPLADAQGNPTYVSVSFSENAYRKYSGNYKVVGKSSSPAAPADPGRVSFYIDIPALPKKSVGIYDGVGITLKADTYEFLRDIITSTLSDFTDIEFPNELIEPGIKVPYELASKQLTITDNSNGVATIVTTAEHDLAPGQRIELVNVDPMLDGFQTISAIPTKFSFQFVLTNPVSKYDKISRIYLDSSLSTAVPLVTSVDMVKFRRVIQYLPQYVRYINRSAGVITVTFNSIHNFKRGDKVIVNFEKNKITEKTEEVKTKNEDGTTTTKKVVVNTFDFDKYNNTVTVASATPTTIEFLDPDPDHVSPAYNTKGNVAPNKNSVKNATPLPLLQLFPQNSSGYNIGDDIRVDGVDQPWWQYPIYDGYHTVYDVNPGLSYAVTKYQVVSEFVNEDEDDNDSKRTVAYVYCTSDPFIEAGDFFVVAGITSRPLLNGEYEALYDSVYDSATGLYLVKYVKQTATVGLTTQSSGVTLTKNGGTWITYQPNTSELRFSLKNEPDAELAISSFSYTAAKGTKKNSVGLKLKSRHGLKVGDTVRVTYGKSEKDVDQKTYGGTVMVTAVPDYDEFYYTLIAGKHTNNAPKKDVAWSDKSGVVVRDKSGSLTPTTVEVEIDSVRTDITAAGATQVTVYAPDHNIKKGDYIAVNVNDSNYKGINTVDKPVKVTSVDADYFRYTAGTAVIEGDTSTISQVIYSSDKKTIKFKASKYGALTASTKTATLLEPKPTTGYVIFTTSATHGMVVGQKATVSGFVAPTSSTTTTVTANHTISSMNYNATTKNVTIVFTSNHGLSLLNDVGASFIVSGANSVAYKFTGTDRNVDVPIGWLNDTHTITAIPDKKTIVFKYLSGKFNFNVYGNGNLNGIGSPTTVSTVTNTQVTFDPQDLTAFNFTAEIADVPSSTKVMFKYPSSADSALSSSINLTGLGITITAAARKATGAEQLEAGDFVFITGFTDIGDNKYSKLNRDGYKVKSVAAISGDTSNVYVTVANPVRDDSKYVAYDNRNSGLGTAVKMYRGYEVGGSAYVSMTSLESADTKNSYVLKNVARASGSNTATVTVGTHDFLVNEYVNIEVYADNQDAFSQNGRDCKITAVTDTTISYTMRANNSIEHISYRAGKATLYFKNSESGAHNYTVGDVITIASIPTYTGFNQTGKTVVATGPYSITYNLTTGEALRTSKLAKTAVTAGTVTRTSTAAVNKQVYGVVTRVPAIYRKPMAYARTYGEFPINAGIGGLTFSDDEYSTKNQSTTPIYGSELKTVAEILDQYSNSLNGFDYRIDVSLATDISGNKSFRRNLVLIPNYPKTLTDYINTLPGNKLAKGQVARPSAFGADKLVFEYPGNISNVSMAEQAENSATRIFVSGKNSNAGSGAESAYAAAADNTLLADNWPLLDKKETVSWPAAGATDSKTNSSFTDEWGNHDDETDYHASAIRFLSETKPPTGDFVISVNGSLTPVVGSYNPGDWCSIIINDDFVRTRLNSVLEPRKDVIVRKIDAIKVDVPNNPAFPENINLTLVADWQVDSVGK